MTDHTVVLFHANCPDGFGAAYAAWKILGNDARYIPVQYGEPLPEIPDGSDVYILDFSYDRTTLAALAGRSKSLVVIDHHKTAREELAGLPYAFFDMDKSGAVLAWEHFHHDAPVPPLLRLIEDRDLWKFLLPNSKEINAAIASYPFDFETWDELREAIENG